MNNIYKHGNIVECCKKQTFLIYIVHLLDKSNINQIHFTTSAQYPITCTEMHTYLRGPVKPHRCACSLYRPAHHRNWLQLLTPILNTANCHMYMSTAAPAEVQCYITQWYHYTPEGIHWIETWWYVCILTKLFVILQPKSNKPYFTTQDYATRGLYYYHHQHHYTFGNLCCFLTPCGWHPVPKYVGFDTQ
jgi:hypothetical protein